MLFAAEASIFARRDLNRILGYFEQAVATHYLDEFKAHFRMQRATFYFILFIYFATPQIL